MPHTHARQACGQHNRSTHTHNRAVMLHLCPLVLALLLASVASAQVLQGQILLPDSLGPLTGISHVALDEDPDYPRMFIGGEDGNVLVMNSLTGERLARIQSGPVKSICFSPTHNKLYISLANEAAVVVIDGSSYQTITRLQLGSFVTGLLYNPLVDRVYCATWLVPVIDCAGDSIVDSVQVRGRKVHLALDTAHNKLYVGSTDTFRVADCSVDSVIASIPGLQEVQAVCYQPTAGKVYVATGESLFAIDTEFDTLVYGQKFDTLDPQLACDPAHNRVYYTYHGTAIALDCANDSIVWSQHLSYRAIALAPDPEHDKLYLLLHGLGSGFPYVLDGATGQTLRELHWTQDSSFYYSAAAKRAFLIWNGGEVTALDCNTDTVVAVTPLAPQIIDVCLDSVDNKLYLSVGKSGVGIVDCATNKVKSYVRASERLRYLAYDSRDDKLYCSSDSSVFVLDSGVDSFVKEIPIRGWARAMNWLPTLNRLYAVSTGQDTPLVVVDCAGDTVVKALDSLWWGEYNTTFLSPELDQFWFVCGRYVVVDCLGDSILSYRESGALGLTAASYDSFNHRVYAVSDHAMHVIDMDTRLPIDSLPSPQGERLSRQVHCATEARKVYWVIMAGFASDTVIAVDTRVDSIVSRFTVPLHSVGVCDDRSGDYVYFAGYGELVVADARTDSIVSSVGLPVNTQFLVPNRATSRLYVVGSTDSVMQVVYDSVIFTGLQTSSGSPTQVARLQTVLSRGAPLCSTTDGELFDASGRQLAVLRRGPNDISPLAPGVYFVREAQAQAVRKVVVTH